MSSTLRISGLASGMDVDSIVEQMMKAEQTKLDKVDKQKMKLEMKQDVWKEMNTKIYSFYTKNVFALKSSSTFQTRDASSSDESKVSVKATSTAVSGSHTIEVSQLAKGAHLYSSTQVASDVTAAGAMSFDLSDGKTTKTIDVAVGGSLSDFVAAINDAGLNIKASYDSTNKRILLNNTSMGTSSRIQFSNIDTTEEQGFFSAIGMDASSGSVADDTVGVYGAKGQNAAYSYNGLALEAESNTVSIDGLNLTLKGLTTAGSGTATPVSVSVTSSTDSVYNKVKEFVTAYNELLKEMNTKLNADSNDYEPLTDKEKESMDEATITKWNDKIKEAFLRRDDKLSDIQRQMRSIVSNSSGVDTASLSDGFKYLSDIGIVSGDYSEYGLLHIEGDEDDGLYGVKENKLKETIEKDPDKVSALLTAIGTSLYSMMSTKSKSTSLNSALTFFNDKQYKTQISDYEERISELEDHMKDMEDSYYKKFSAMEEAIQKANSQSSYLMSMMGTSTSA